MHASFVISRIGIKTGLLVFNTHLSSIPYNTELAITSFKIRPYCPIILTYRDGDSTLRTDTFSDLQESASRTF